MKTLALSLAVVLAIAAVADAKTRSTTAAKSRRKAAAGQKQPTSWLQRFHHRQMEAERQLGKTKLETTEPSGQHVNLAVTDKDMRLPVRIVTIRGKAARTPGFTVALDKDLKGQDIVNGVGTCYRIVAPLGLVGIRIKIRVGNKGGKGTRIVTYVPCTDEYRRPEMVRAGLRYLEDGTYRQMKALGVNQVMSRAYRGKTVADVIAQRAQIVKAVTEKIDPNRFIAEGKPVATIEAVLAAIYANGTRAYEFAWSRKVVTFNDKKKTRKSVLVAGGMAQFICPSYETMLGSYPAAGLAPGKLGPRRRQLHKYDCRRISWPQFVAAMNDHRNAFRAMYLHDDYCIGSLRSAHPSLATRLKRAGLLAFGRWLAAAYNGGCDAAIGALKSDPAAWTAPHGGLELESRRYVVVFTAVYTYLYGKG